MKEPIEGAVCPFCGGQIQRTDRFVMCENEGRDPDDCHFIMPGKTASGKEIPDADVLKLCNGEMIGPYTLIGKPKNGAKTGQKYKAWFKFDESNGQVKYVFDPDEHTTEYKCPKCGGVLTCKSGQYGPYLSCENRDFHMSLEPWQHKLNDKEIRQLLNGETIYADDFVSRKGSNFSANLSMDPDTGKFSLNFDD